MGTQRWVGLLLVHGVGWPLPSLRAEPREPPPAKATTDSPRPWSLRLAALGGVALPSDQEELLELQGYGGPRAAVRFAVARRLGEHVGLGVSALYGFRSSSASEDAGEDEMITVTGEAPEYRERLLIAAAELPLRFPLDRRGLVELTLTPQAGVASALAELHGGGAWQLAPAFGGAVELFFPRGFIGFGAGFYVVPAPRAGQTGGSQDFGMAHLTFSVGLDVG